MVEADKREFGSLLNAIAEMKRQPLGMASLDLWFASLSEFPVEAVRWALSQHVRDPNVGTYMPMPADVIRRIQQRDGRPGAEEAWSMIPRDEAQSCVWTEEMSQAFGVALPLIQDGDAVAGRMAFLEKYRTLVQEARERGTPVRWSASLGHDPAGREGALTAAVEKGRLPAAHAMALLPEKGTELAVQQLAAKLPGLTTIGRQAVDRLSGDCCAVCNGPRSSGLHQIVTTGPKEGQPWGHAFVERTANASTTVGASA